MEGYTIEKQLGEGSQGEVSLVRRRSDMNLFALKRIPKKGMSRNVRMELYAGKKLNDPRIAQLVHDFQDDKNYYLVFEYVRGTDLLAFLQDRDCEPLSENETRRIFRQIAKAIYYTHSRKIAHSDLKLENIMINPHTNAIKVIDFGLCHEAEAGKLAKINGCSLEYAAPEILEQSRAGMGNIRCDLQKCDIFSLGVILYTLLFGEFPFDIGVRVMQRRHTPIRFNSDKVDISEEVEDLIIGMTEYDPDERYSIQEVLTHPWMIKSFGSI